MKRGVWHQCGDKSQKLVQEQLENGVGAGVILSPRDLAKHKAAEYTLKYKNLGADVLFDPQFYVPHFSNNNLDSYNLADFRKSVSELYMISDTELKELVAQLLVIGTELQCTGLIAPAIVYEAARDEIVTLNARLFKAAKEVGNALGVPTYASVFLGRSVGGSAKTLAPLLSQVTGLDADGWYFGFEFDQERIPSSREGVARYLSAGLTLACTGKPVLHGYSGQMGILSFGVGATAVGIGHSQNVWKFSRERWEPSTGQGGGGDAPARFFSSTLWGTIIYPDETSRLPGPVLSQVLTHTAFSSPVRSNLSWGRWDSNKHLVNIIGSTLTQVSALGDPRQCASQALRILDKAVDLHSQIAGAGIVMGDNTNSYQKNWRDALSDTLTDRKRDYDYLALLAP